jgi:cell wall-associated NlpC family hydrolase
VDSSRAKLPKRFSVFLVSAAACAALLVIPGPADATVGQAAPQTVKAEPSLSEVRKQVDELDKKMVDATEQFNQARVLVQQSQDKLSALQGSMAAKRADVAKQQAEVGKLAAVVYRQGDLGSMTVVAGSSNADLALDQLTVLHEIQQQRQAKISALTKSKKALEKQEKSIKATMADQQKQLDTVRGEQDSINKDLAKWKTLRARLGGGLLDSVYDTVAYMGQGIGNAVLAIKFALSQQGKPYVWGTAGPATYDCSGLTMAAWRAGGFSLPHSAAMQYRAIPHVSRSNLQPGDLVFYGSSIHHVAMFIGNGQVVHAPHTGSPVQVASIDDAGGSSPSGYGRP